MRRLRFATWLTAALAASLLGGFLALRRARAVERQQAPCAVRGPTPLGAPVTAAERAAVPLAFQGNVVVSVASSDRITIIDLATGEQRSVESGIDEPHELTVSPDGRWAVAADFGDHLGDFAFDGTELGVYELPSGRLARRIDLGRFRGPHDLVFTGPTRLAVTTQTSQHVIEVDVVTGRVLGATETRAKGSHTLAVTADGRLAFTANQPDGSLSRLDLANRRFLSRHVVGRGETEGIAATPDGKDVWMGFGGMGAVLVVDGATGAVRDTLSGFGQPERMAMSADGRYAAITDFRCEVVQVADVRARRVLGPIAGLEGAGIAKILPDNRTAVIVLLDERVVAMADLATRRVVARHPLRGARPDAAAWGPAPRYRGARALDLTGDGRADSVRLEAHGTRPDSLDVTLVLLVDGEEKHRERWASSYELALTDTATRSGPRAERLLRAKLDAVLASVMVQRLDAPGVRLMAEDSAVLAGLTPRPTQRVSFSYGYETTTRLVWDAPRRRFVRLWSCC